MKTKNNKTVNTSPATEAPVKKILTNWSLSYNIAKETFRVVGDVIQDDIFKPGTTKIISNPVNPENAGYLQVSDSYGQIICLCEPSEDFKETIEEGIKFAPDFFEPIKKFFTDLITPSEA